MNDKNKENITNEQTCQIITEKDYLKVRNEYALYFKNISENAQDWEGIYKQDTDSLLVLEKMLREIMKNSRIDSVAKFGKINLETLTPELGFGLLDCLVLNNNSTKIFVTTKGLFLDYFKSQQINSIDNLTSKQLSNIFSALLSDARSTVFYSEQYSSNKYSKVYGSIGTIAQDIGRFPPNNIFVLIADEDYIYIIQKLFDKPINEISECQAIYDSIYNNSQIQFDKYKASDLTDKKALDNSLELQETAWNKYCECYQENFRTYEEFDTVQKQMEKIVQYVE
jgi:hypothetical protein